ncbi:MAG: acyltransferase [Muribaculaceae bacterium]|nr:acyltransferase [Muribaculaceae bacterium]
MGHVITMCIRDIDQSFIFKIIGQIHMPLFFFISGYFTYKAYDNNTFKTPNFKQKFVQLIVPVLVTGSLWVLFFPHSGLQSPLKPGLAGFWTDLWKNGYWFTLCLFQILALYALIGYVLRKTEKIFTQIITITLICVILGVCCIEIPQPYTNIIGLQLVFEFFPIFMLGVYAKKHRTMFKCMSSNKKCMTICLAIASISAYVLCYWWEFPWINYTINLAVKIVFQFSIATIALNCVKSWEEYNANKVFLIFAHLGQKSLSIYLLHYFFLFPLTFLQQPMREMALGFTPLATISAIVAAIIIAIALIADYIISRSKLFSLLLIGNTK